MATLLYTVQNLIDEVRAQLDEENRDSVDTDRDILPSLNRAQDYAFDILARKYEEPILAKMVLDLTGAQQEYDIPEDVFEDRIQKIEIMVPSSSTGQATFREVQRISYRDVSNYESTTKTNVPYYYCIVGRKIRFIPYPAGTYNARVWYLRNPEKLKSPQGRLTVVNNTSNYVVVDSAGDSLTTQADQLGSYVNIIDGQTGEIKGTLQIQTLSENKVTFRTVPARTAVLGRTVSGSLESTGASLDDYLSPIDGTCVPYYGKPTCNFLIQFTVSEITRKLGGSAELEEKILEKFEKQVERTWVGREVQLRIKKKSSNWGVPINRWWYQ
jgi:hypothetical protein